MYLLVVWWLVSTSDSTFRGSVEQLRASKGRSALASVLRIDELLENDGDQAHDDGGSLMDSATARFD